MIPFFLISLCLHLVFLFPWSNAPEIKEKTREPIPVAFLPLAQKEKVESSRKTVQRKSVARSPKTMPQTKELARKPTPSAKKPTRVPERNKRRPWEPQAPPLQTGERKTIVRRPLPSFKELLPPINWSQSRERKSFEDGAVRLDTQDPQYVSYLSSVKRAIMLVWKYPDLALRHGLQGKLVLEFTILGNGTLMETQLVRSSGFSVLDEEALRAVQAAAPFRPIPRWVRKDRLPIIASFEYLDNRLEYSFAP